MGDNTQEGTTTRPRLGLIEQHPKQRPLVRKRKTLKLRAHELGVGEELIDHPLLRRLATYLPTTDGRTMERVGMARTGGCRGTTPLVRDHWPAESSRRTIAGNQGRDVLVGGRVAIGIEVQRRRWVESRVMGM